MEVFLWEAVMEIVLKISSFLSEVSVEFMGAYWVQSDKIDHTHNNVVYGFIINSVLLCY